MVSEQELSNRLMLQARDVMDRSFRDELDVKALAAVALVSPAHFIRRFKQHSVKHHTVICSGVGWNGRCFCSETPIPR
jgi:transcriptional regulator GlxA family with amidase domain